MAIWFSCKIKYFKPNNEGLSKSVTETYLIDAMSYTEAESRIMLEMEGISEFTIQSITKTNINDVVLPGKEGEVWFKSKVTYAVQDEDSEKEKKVTSYILISATSVKDAYERLEDWLRGMTIPYQIPKVEETTFMDVYPHIAGMKPGMKRVEGSEGGFMDEVTGEVLPENSTGIRPEDLPPDEDEADLTEFSMD